MFVTLWNFVKFLGIIILILLLFAIIFAIVDVMINEIYMSHTKRKLMKEIQEKFTTISIEKVEEDE